MKLIPSLISKELKGYFYSPVAYVVMAASLLINGWTFWLITIALASPNAQMAGSIMQIFFGGTFFYWFQIFLLTPVITMRLLAEEKKTGTIETLLTAPVTDFEVVVSKFLSAWIFFVTMWCPTLLYMFILRGQAMIDTGPVITGYIGTFLVGGLFLAVGLLMSSLTKNQIIAAVGAFALSLTMFASAFLSFFIKSNVFEPLISYINILEHFEDFGKGVIDTRAVFYYISGIIFFLFLTIRAVEGRKWR